MWQEITILVYPFFIDFKYTLIFFLIHLLLIIYFDYSRDFFSLILIWSKNSQTGGDFQKVDLFLILRSSIEITEVSFQFDGGSCSGDDIGCCPIDFFALIGNVVWFDSRLQFETKVWWFWHERFEFLERKDKFKYRTFKKGWNILQLGYGILFIGI